jgi:hypothetical protein
MLRAIVTVAQMLVLYSAAQARKENLGDLMKKEGWLQEDAEDIRPSHVELVQEMADRFMTLTTHRGLPIAMDWVLRLRAYGNKIRGDTYVAGVVQ